MKYWIAAVLLLPALTGCGGGGEPLDRLEAPAFDLTGRWVTAAIDCGSFSSDLPEAALAKLDGQLEDETLRSPGVRIVQTGNDLEFTDLEGGRRWDGTMSGDQFHFADSGRGDVGGPDADAYLEVEGTALDEDRIAVTHEVDWAFRAEGRTVTGGTVCSARLQRAGAEEPVSAVPGDVGPQPPFTGTVVISDIDRPIGDWGDDPYRLGIGDDGPVLEGDVLTFTVSYGGGCRRHDFTLVADDRFMESDPVKLNVFLAHDAHDDPCEAYPRQRYAFDLTPLTRLYRDAYGRDAGVIILGLHRPVPSRRAPGPGHAFDVTYAFE
ncbi:MAG: hypothetical protein OXP66_11755 [Candidatus Tectomicrobia bacterium]|nr:hypothetical protein [Candidatus Tectomicrobia bacterium]